MVVLVATFLFVGRFLVLQRNKNYQKGRLD